VVKTEVTSAALNKQKQDFLKKGIEFLSSADLNGLLRLDAGSMRSVASLPARQKEVISVR
jgi:hypothetical protein